MAGIATSDLAYPDRFYAAATYTGFRDSGKPAISLSNETSSLLYGLYQQATVGPCNVPKPRAWSTTEQNKWKSWSNLGHLSSSEAMRLFVKILEEEDPAWFSRASKLVMDTEVSLLGSDISDKEISTRNGMENGNHMDPIDKDVVLEGLSAVSVVDHWAAVPVSSRRPTARYEHAAEVVQDKMYVVGGNYNGRYLNDVQVLDLKSFKWSKIEPKMDASTESDQSSEAPLSPCAGHSLVRWGKKLLVVGGHSKNSSDSIIVRAFDTQTHSWSILKAYGNAPPARGGQSVNIVGSTLLMFGGEDSKRHLLNDLHVLDLETMTWDAVQTVGTPPAPRSDHVAAVHLDRYLLIFGGGSHSTCFNDLHVLDMQNMEWSQPQGQGHLLTPRAGHAGVTIGDYWYIVGGGDNKSGVSETLALNMSKLVWAVVTTVEGRVPIASEGLSLVSASVNGEDVLLTFGGYNGRYINEVHILKPSQKQHSQPKILQSPAAAAAAASVAAAYAAESSPVPLSDGVPSIESEDFIQESNTNKKNDEENEKLLADLRAENERLQSSISSVESENSLLKQRISESEAVHDDLVKEVQSVRGQLATEQNRCFKLEVDIAELKQKLSSYEDLQKEIDLLRRQKAAAEEAAIHAARKQSSGGVWSWIAGTPPPQQTV